MFAWRRTTKTISAALTAVALSLPLAACSSEPPQRAATLDEAEPPNDSDGDSTSGGDGDGLAAAGQPLTDAQAEKALPSVATLPAGWSVDPDDSLHGEDDDDEQTVRPARCEQVFEGIRAVTKAQEPSADASVTFMAGALGPFLGVKVSSYPDEVPDEAFGAVIDGLAECPTFEIDDGEEVAKVEASALSFPNLGEESLALRFTMESPSFTAGADFVVVRVGHNVVGAEQVGIGGAADIGPLRKAVTATMESLRRN